MHIHIHICTHRERKGKKKEGERESLFEMAWELGREYSGEKEQDQGLLPEQVNLKMKHHACSGEVPSSCTLAEDVTPCLF